MPDPEGFKAGSAWMDVKPNIDEAEWHAKIAAAVAGASSGTGASAGGEIGQAISRNIEQGARDGAVRGGTQITDKLSAAIQDAKPELVRDADEIAHDVGASIGDGTASEVAGRLRDARGRFVTAGRGVGADLGDGVDAGLSGRLADELPRFGQRGQTVGLSVGRGVGKGIKDSLPAELPDAIEKPLEESGRKGGEKAGAAAGQGMSPLILSALAAAGSVGGPLLMAGIGAGMVGATALVLKQNKVIDADFHRIGADASAAITSAAEPMTGEMHVALNQLDSQIGNLTPEFKNLFAAAEPDISAVTSGLTGFVGHLLPGVSTGIANSQVIVKDFSQSLPVLGSGVGSFFSGIVRNADVQGAALEHTVGVVGNAFSTLGTVIGSASAATSQALLAIDPVINTVLGAVQSLSSPATIGGVLGLFGAMKLDPKIQSGLLSGAEGLSKVADKAEESSGLLGKVGGAASGASGFLGKMAGVVGGPWGIAIGAGIGLASGLAAALFHTSDATAAVTLNVQDLQQAVEADGGAAGQSTSAYVAQQAALSGLADTASKAGVPLDLLTQAAIGNKQAQQELTVAVGHANVAQRAQQATIGETLDGAAAMPGVMKTGSDALQSAMVTTNTMTDANQKLVNSIKAQSQQTADAISKQTLLDAATNTLNNSTNIFNATLDSDYQKLVKKAQASADSTIATLNLGQGQSALNQWLAGSVDSYQLAAAGGSSYASVLQSLNDTESNLLTSRASFTIALAGVTTAIAANGRSLDDTNVKGAQNVQVFAGIASSAQKAAVALYQSEVSTKGASQAYTDANAKLLAEKNAFIAAADKAGFNKDKVKELANELYNLPESIPINIDANTNPALVAVSRAIRIIDNQIAYVQVAATGAGTGGPTGVGGRQLLGNAGGGPVTAGSIRRVGEHGEETMAFGQDAYILTHGQTVARDSRPSTGQPQIVNTFNYYGTQQPTPEQNAGMMRQLAASLT